MMKYRFLWASGTRASHPTAVAEPDGAGQVFYYANRMQGFGTQAKKYLQQLLPGRRTQGYVTFSLPDLYNEDMLCLLKSA